MGGRKGRIKRKPETEYYVLLVTRGIDNTVLNCHVIWILFTFQSLWVTFLRNETQKSLEFLCHLCLFAVIHNLQFQFFFVSREDVQ